MRKSKEYSENIRTSVVKNNKSRLSLHVIATATSQNIFAFHS